MISKKCDIYVLIGLFFINILIVCFSVGFIFFIKFFWVSILNIEGIEVKVVEVIWVVFLVMVNKIDKELFVIYIVIDFCRDCIINIYYLYFYI